MAYSLGKNLALVLFCLFALFLSPGPLKAEAIDADSLMQALEAKDAATTLALLEQSGSLPEDLEDDFLADNPDPQYLLYDKGYLLFSLDTEFGKCLWVFLREEPGTGKLLPLGAEIFWDYPAFDQAPQMVGTGQDQGLLFSVQSTPMKGSGVYFRQISWHFLPATGPAKAQRVLDYPLEGYVSGWDAGFDREFSSQTTSCGLVNGVFSVDITITARYMITDTTGATEPVELFAYTAPVRYVFSPQVPSFVVDPRASKLSREQVDGLFNDDADGLLAHNLPRLIALAKRGTEVQKDWLRALLPKCADSSAKKTLSLLLGQ